MAKLIPANLLKRSLPADLWQRLAEQISANNIILKRFPALPADLRQRLATPIPTDEVLRIVAACSILNVVLMNTVPAMSTAVEY